MGRSAEAIARRAAKRGKSEKEQVAADRENERKRAEKRYLEAVAARERKSVVAAGSKVQKEKRRRRLPQNISRKRKAVAWEAPQASSEVVARNQELREAYLKDPSSLSEEDRVRAKLLVERSERKKKRRMKRKVSSKAVEKKERG